MAKNLKNSIINLLFIVIMFIPRIIFYLRKANLIKYISRNGAKNTLAKANERLTDNDDIQRKFKLAINYYRQRGLINTITKAYHTLFRGRLSVPNPLEIEKSRAVYDIIFVVGCWDGTAKRYRVYDRVRYLETLGYKILVIRTEDVPLITKQDIVAPLVIFFRCAYDQAFYNSFFRFAKKNNIFTAWDVDDLIFDPKEFDNIHGANNLSDIDKKKYIEDVHNYQKMLKVVDMGIYSTKALHKKGLKFNKNGVISNNGFDFISQETANKILAERKTISSEKKIYIGYFSGTNTHSVDFKQCEAALIGLLKKYDHVIFVLGGYLDLSEDWDIFKDRVIKLEFVNYHYQLKYLSQVDINIAPLEIDNIFCESKSNLKFYEAALVKTPTVASPTEPFKSVIVNHKNGFLASTEREWFNSLSSLIEDNSLRERIGNQAHAYALENYNQKSSGEQYLSLLKNKVNNFPKPSGRKISEKTLRVAFIVDGLPLNSGGHRNIFRIGYQLSQNNFKVTFYFKNENHRSISSLKEDILNHFYDFDFDIFHLDSVPSNQDILFATYYQTVYDALKFKGHVSSIYYLVQDLEYLFFPMSSDYIRAENTYKLNLKTVTSGTLPEKILIDKYKNNCTRSFNFPINNHIYNKLIDIKRANQIIFFAKPEMPRRCYEIGIEVLEILKDKLPNYELILFGSNNIPVKHKIKFKNLGVLPHISDLAELYRTSRLGIVFSTTNPSLVPYEMMACGLPVVDMESEYAYVNYGSTDKNAFLFNSVPEMMSKQIIDALKNKDELTQRAERSYKFVKNFPSDAEVGTIVAEFISESFYQHDGFL